MKVSVTFHGRDIHWITPELVKEAEKAAQAAYDQSGITDDQMGEYLDKIAGKPAKAGFAWTFTHHIRDMPGYKVNRKVSNAALDAVGNPPPDWTGGYEVDIKFNPDEE